MASSTVAAVNPATLAPVNARVDVTDIAALPLADPMNPTTAIGD